MSSTKRWIAPTQHTRQLDPLDRSVEPAHPNPVSLRDVLLNSSALGYFMEFMDRRQQSRLVQFWVTVESFKDPLVEVESSEDETNDTQIDSLQSRAWPTAAQDISMIWEIYLSPTCHGGPIVQHDRLTGGVWTFVNHLDDEGEDIQVKTRRLDVAIRAVFHLQKKAYRRLEEDHYSKFLTTELYLKAATEINKVGQAIEYIGTSGRGTVSSTNGPPSHPSVANRQPSGKSGWRPFRTSIDLGGSRRASAEQGKVLASPASALSASLHGSIPEGPAMLRKARSLSMSTSRKEFLGPEAGDPALGFLVGLESPASLDDADHQRSLFGAADQNMSASILSTDDLLPNGRLPDADGEQVETERIEALQAAPPPSSIPSEQDDRVIRPKRTSSRNSSHDLLRAFTATSRATSITGIASVAVDRVTADKLPPFLSNQRQRSRQHLVAFHHPDPRRCSMIKKTKRLSWRIWTAIPWTKTPILK